MCYSSIDFTDLDIIRKKSNQCALTASSDLGFSAQMICGISARTSRSLLNARSKKKNQVRVLSQHLLILDSQLKLYVVYWHGVLKAINSPYIWLININWQEIWFLELFWQEIWFLDYFLGNNTYTLDYKACPKKTLLFEILPYLRQYF